MFRRKRAMPQHHKGKKPCSPVGMVSPRLEPLPSHCLQLGAFLNPGLQRELQAAQALAVSLRKRLDSEKQQHAATAACLQQEQDMLAILASRLAAVETVAGCQTSGLTALQQQLQAERQLHDVTIKSLLEQHRQNMLLKQQLIKLESRAANRSRGCGRLLRHLVVPVTCLAAGAAVAVVRLPLDSIPPGLQALAQPAMTGVFAAKTAATVLRGMRRLVGSLWDSNQQQRTAVGVPCIHDSTAPGTVRSWNCWRLCGLGLLDQEANSGQDDDNTSVDCSSCSTHSGYSLLSVIPGRPACHDCDDMASHVSHCSDCEPQSPAPNKCLGPDCVLAWVLAHSDAGALPELRYSSGSLVHVPLRLPNRHA